MKENTTFSEQTDKPMKEQKMKAGRPHYQIHRNKDGSLGNLFSSIDISVGNHTIQITYYKTDGAEIISAKTHTKIKED